MALVHIMYRSGSALSQLYGTEATLEHHHFNHAVMILNSEVFIAFYASAPRSLAGVYI